MGYDLFLSYSRKDKAVADAFYEAASGQGLTVWYDKLLQGGQDWRQGIVEALTQSNALIILFSKESNASKQLIKELAVADDLGKLVIPVLIEDAKPEGAYLYEMSSRNWIALYPDPIRKMARLVEEVTTFVKPCAKAADGVAAFRDAAPMPAPTPPKPAKSTLPSDDDYWLPVRRYDGIFLTVLFLFAVLEATGAIHEGLGAGLNLLFVIPIYLLLLAVRNARLNRGVFSMKSFASYVLTGALSVPFCSLPNHLAGAKITGDVSAFIFLAILVAIVANILQVILRPIFQRNRFHEIIAGSAAKLGF